MTSNGHVHLLIFRSCTFGMQQSRNRMERWQSVVAYQPLVCSGNSVWLVALPLINVPSPQQGLFWILHSFEKCYTLQRFCLHSANALSHESNLMSREYYEAVSDVLNWVLNGRTDTFFEYEDELFAWLIKMWEGRKTVPPFCVLLSPPRVHFYSCAIGFHLCQRREVVIILGQVRVEDRTIMFRHGKSAMPQEFLQSKGIAATINQILSGKGELGLVPGRWRPNRDLRRQYSKSWADTNHAISRQ